MKKVNECKIIANLLPNYVDHLTDKEISRYIEDHIATCPECAQKLEDMSEKLDIEKEHDERNLRQLKRFRRRIIRFIAMCVGIVIIIATGVVIYNNYKNGIKVNNYTFVQAEYVKEDNKNSKDGKIYGTVIAVFDEKDICISARVVEKGYTNEYLENNSKKNNLNFMKAITNYETLTNEEHYNINTWNGLSKEKTIEKLSKDYKQIIIEKI